MSRHNLGEKNMNKEYKQIITYSGLASDGYNFCISDSYTSTNKTEKIKHGIYLRKRFKKYQNIRGCIRLQENNRKNVSAIISDIIMVTYKYSFENNYEVQIDNWRNPDFKMLVDDRGWVDKQLEKKYA